MLKKIKIGSNHTIYIGDFQIVETKSGFQFPTIACIAGELENVSLQTQLVSGNYYRVVSLKRFETIAIHGRYIWTTEWFVDSDNWDQVDTVYIGTLAFSGKEFLKM